LRIDNLEIAMRNGDSIQIGGDDLYTFLVWKHFFEWFELAT